jgi:DNA-binding IclR family transcriptional regulator
MPPPWPTASLRVKAQQWFQTEGCTQNAKQLPGMAKALDLTNSEALFLLRTLEEEGVVEVSTDRGQARHLRCR